MKGFHLMVDGKVNEPPTKEWLLEVMEELARLTHMNFILGPYVVEGIPENPGLTAIGEGIGKKLILEGKGKN